MLIFARPELHGYLVGLVLVAIGQAIRLWSSGHLVKSEELITSGPFRWVRNPLYVGSFIVALGYCAMTGGWLVWALVVPLFVVTHSSAVFWEERLLRELYGESFTVYCSRVPRWFPRIPKGFGPGKPFSWTQAKNNTEFRTMLGTVLVAAAFGLKLHLLK